MKKDNEDRRLIEEFMPIEKISLSSITEKNSRKGNISQFHVWWARKPLIASRVVIYASLISSFNSNSRQILNELSEFGSHEKKHLIKKIKDEMILSKKYRFKILDPFAGGGSIPLEALRLGCETYALDLNPVAHIIELCTLVYPQKYGNPVLDKSGFTKIDNKLADDIRHWGNIVYKNAEKTLSEFYINSNDESPTAFFWVRTIKCKNPSCESIIPLFNNFWLQKKGTQYAIKLIIKKSGNKPLYKILKNSEIDFDPEDGIVKTGTALCPFCNSTMNSSEIQEMAKKGEMGEHMFGVLVETGEGKKYRLPNEKDLILLNI